MEMRQHTMDRSDSPQGPDTEPVKLFPDEWDEKDFTGPIEVQEKKPSARKSVKRLAERALRVEAEPSRPVTLTIEGVLEGLDRQRREDDRDDAYSELGGGMRAYSRGGEHGFTPVFDLYQPWHEETRAAVEDFRLYDMSRSDFEAMTSRDRKRFSLHAFNFIEKSKSLASQINLNRGESPEWSPVHNRFGSEHSQSELLQYAKTIGLLNAAIEYSGLAGIIRDEINIPPQKWSNYATKRGTAMERAFEDSKRHGAVRMVYEGGKFRVVKQALLQGL